MNVASMTTRVTTIMMMKMTIAIATHGQPRSASNQHEQTCALGPAILKAAIFGGTCATPARPAHTAPCS